MWAELKFPPINLWNFPKQNRDISEKELEAWHDIWEDYSDDND